MKKLFIALSICPLIVWGQRFGGYSPKQPNTLAPIPMQVMEEGKATNFAVGTHLITHMGTTNILSNMFKGFIKTNATWILYSNSVNNTGSIIIDTVLANQSKYGYFMPTVTDPVNDINNHTWLSKHARGSNDVCVQATFKAGLRPSVLVMGCTLSISNWTPTGTTTTGKGFDLMRIGQSPYVILQFGDSSEIVDQLTLQIHTPATAGVGVPVIILDNGEVYEVMFIYDAPNDKASLRVWQRLSNGRYQFKGESNLPITDTPLAAENVFIGVSDDHSGWNFSSSIGGDFRLSNIWASTNRAIFYSSMFPTY